MTPRPIQTPRGARPAAAGVRGRALPALALLAFLGACASTAPDKRVLQYLNDDGFGNRYTGNAEEQNYVTIGDTVSLVDAYHPDLATSQTVDVDGTIVLPEIGAVHVAGQTRSELEAFLVQKYSPYYEQLDIDVRLGTAGKFYFIFGEVGAEGKQQFPGDLTVFEAVMAASPDDRTANLGRVRVIRADPRDPLILYVNLAELLNSGDSTFNVHVHERDIIVVPPTFLAEVGHFLTKLLYPITEVIREVSSALWYWYPELRNYGRRGGGNNNNNFY
jgi:protein involved in polysaccharide export with SLBB domain